MGKMNLLKANWTGKVGQTVGAKWKNKSTLRTFTKPSDPKTDAQLEVRHGFTYLTKFVALFADQIKYKSALDTSGMSVKNAIIKMNKELIKEATINPTDIQISKGGLQTPNTLAGVYSSASGKISVTWVKPTATNFSSEAKIILVAVDDTDKVAAVVDAAFDAETAEIDFGTTLSGDKVLYGYYLDKRGSSKIGSISSAVEVTA